jgi:polysaccharide export outer membrane protein
MNHGMKLLLGILLALQLLVAAPARAQDRAPDYRLGAGDAIRISVFQNPDLTVETRVADSGIITYPLIGSVQLGGNTIPEAEKAIADKLREGGFVQKPQVNILLTQVRGNQVSVLGMISRPGRYPIETGNTRLSDMLATAGGAVPGGSDVVILSGIREGKPFRREIDVPALFGAERSSEDVLVAGGEVQRPGPYRIERDMTVLQALVQGGGLTLRGTERSMRIHRRGADGKVSEIAPEKSDLVRADDVIQVQESLF